MIKEKLVLILIMLIITGKVVYSSPVDLPTSAKELEGKIWSYKKGGDWSEDIEMALAIETDIVVKRELDRLSAEVEGNIYSGKLIYSFADIVDIYGTFGQAQDMEYKAKILGSDVKFEGEDKFAWSVGLSALIWEGEDSGIKLFCDGKYRAIRNIDYKSVTVDGVKYSKSELTGTKIDANWEEWQFAFGMSKQFNFLIPYVGVKYSDVDASAKATIGGTTYDLGSANSDDVVGVFVGCSIIPMQQFSVDLEGRFIDESAFTVRVNYKF